MAVQLAHNREPHPEAEQAGYERLCTWCLFAEAVV